MPRELFADAEYSTMLTLEHQLEQRAALGVVLVAGVVLAILITTVVVVPVVGWFQAQVVTDHQEVVVRVVPPALEERPAKLKQVTSTVPEAAEEAGAQLAGLVAAGLPVALVVLLYFRSLRSHIP